MNIVTRFAPSPTGYIHIGNVRSAIYPYLLAHQSEGEMILRIEDTDRARYVEGATELIEDTLEWLGLNWDEGPIVGGPNGPYFQSERKDIYHAWARKLIASGRAYADPTTPEEIAKYREECNKAKTPFLYRNYRPENTPEWEPGIPLRFKTEPKEYSWHDEVMGDMHAGPEVLDDIILIKKDGYPTYNFAHIVDEYRDDGVLAEAMLNYLACLGWNDGTEQEIYTKSELIQKFSLDRIQSSGARYDETKLLWLNGQWIRKIFTEQGADALYARTDGFWPDIAASATDKYKLQVLSIIYDRLKTLSDLRDMTAYFFSDPRLDLDMLINNKYLKKLSESEMEGLLKLTIAKLTDLESWDADSIQNALNELLADTGKKPAELFSLIRIAVSFAPFSPALHLTLSILGRDTSLARLNTVARNI